jgi:hypothetical protein
MFKNYLIVLSVLSASSGLLATTTADAQVLKYRNNLDGSSVISADPDQTKAAKSIKEKIVIDGAVLMTRDEVVQHLSGNTQQWSNGGAHYRPDGRLDFIWEGDLFNDYEWRVRGEGRVCIDNPAGFTTSCSLYYKYKGGVWTVITEEFGEKRDFFGGPDTILVGEKLADLEPWDPALSGR